MPNTKLRVHGKVISGFSIQNGEWRHNVCSTQWKVEIMSPPQKVEYVVKLGASQKVECGEIMNVEIGEITGAPHSSGKW